MAKGKMVKEQICIRGGLDDSFLVEKENMAKVSN